ncbi:DUF4931 domain-containing protein [bacterium]|nr:DUF4931 domain-containing protein [bacterium]
MPEFRHDPVQKRWVIIAIERGKRPDDFKEKNNDIPHVEFCPFCEGNEDKTPNEIFAIREKGTKANEPGWKIRVIPNKFPALTSSGDLNREGLGIYDVMNGVGAHEVIVETTQHDLHMGDMPLDHLFQITKIYRDRILSLMENEILRYVLIFKNHGKTAGASLEHPHTQIIATPITPLTIAQELTSSREHYLAKERCLFCDILTQELHVPERIVIQTPRFVVLAPYASRFPFECWLLPRFHSHDFTRMEDDELREFATVLKEVLYRLKVCLGDPPYNFMLHTAPNPHPRPGKPDYWSTLEYDYHWHIEIIPRVTRVAGFEWGTGFYINPTPPEIACKYLKQVELPQV